MSALEVAKVNKRLIIRDVLTGARVYVMPDFLKPVRDRGVMKALAQRLEAGDGVTAVIDFETAHSRAAPPQPAGDET